MEPRKPPEFILDISADRSSVRDVVRGILHIIFFHRYFPPIAPSTHDILSLTLPYVSEPSIASLIDTRTSQLNHTKHQIIVQFLERKRRKGWFVAKADEETVWENWIVNVRVGSGRERGVAERSLAEAAMRVVEICGRERGHIPPITTNESNPFPFAILVDPKGDGWGAKMGIF